MDMGAFLKKKKKSGVVFYSFYKNLLQTIPIKICLGT